MSRPKERLFLLDGMALAYRAYFSFITPPLVNSKGENTSAIFGFVNTLMKILNDERPDHIAVVFDTKEPTFRHAMYEPYKATREKMPEDMSSQLGKLKEVVEAFNVPLLELPGYEADDIMGTLARKAEKENIETMLVTGDKDFMQLISPLVRMYKPGKQGDEWEVLDEKAVMAKFGVAPDLVIDVLGLIGDKSDNVPGVPGVGEKTAIPLVQKYGSMENIYKHIDEIPQNGLREKLKTHRELALLSKKLVTIDTEVPITADIHRLQAQERDNARLIKLFGELEFKNLLRKLSDSVVTTGVAGKEISGRSELPTDLPSDLTDIRSDKHSYHLVANEKDFAKLLGALRKAKKIVFDTETTGVDPLRAELVGLSFAVKPGEAWYIALLPDMADDMSKLVGLPAKDVLASLSPIFSDPSIMKIGQNIKYDALVLASHNVQVEGIAFDTMVANYILRADGQHNMDDMAREHLRYKTITYDELTGEGKQRKALRDVEVERVSDYSCEDADITLRLYEVLVNKLAAQELTKLAMTIEIPLIPVLASMELTGVALDTAFLADLSKELERVLDNLISTIHRRAGETFNINSTKQLSAILFEKLKLATVRKTKTGFSTDVGVLETLRHEHPIIEELLEYRQNQKLKSTYVDALPSLINPRTGRLHTSFNQTVAATGRLSSSDPNLQNIPIRSEIGRSIRKAFIPGDPNSLILSADYSQIELRIMAHVSGDEGLRDAFLHGEDIHTTTAAKVFGVKPANVTKDMRRKAKEVNFGIMYGIGPFGLANRLDINQGEAKEIIVTYFERFPKVKQYISDTLAGARNTGYVSTLLGRRRYLPDLKSKNFSVRSNAERQAINMPIQGTAADMIKVAMINIHNKIRSQKAKIKMLLQVHDELVFEIAAKEEQKAKRMIVEEMQNALPLSVPVGVDAGAGKNWLEAH